MLNPRRWDRRWFNSDQQNKQGLQEFKAVKDAAEAILLDRYNCGWIALLFGWTTKWSRNCLLYERKFSLWWSCFVNLSSLGECLIPFKIWSWAIVRKADNKAYGATRSMACGDYQVIEIKNSLGPPRRTQFAHLTHVMRYNIHVNCYLSVRFIGILSGRQLAAMAVGKQPESFRDVSEEHVRWFWQTLWITHARRVSLCRFYSWTRKFKQVDQKRGIVVVWKTVRWLADGEGVTQVSANLIYRRNAVLKLRKRKIGCRSSRLKQSNSNTLIQTMEIGLCVVVRATLQMDTPNLAETAEDETVKYVKELLKKAVMSTKICCDTAYRTNNGKCAGSCVRNIYRGDTKAQQERAHRNGSFEWGHNYKPNNRQVWKVTTDLIQCLRLGAIDRGVRLERIW